MTIAHRRGAGLGAGLVALFLGIAALVVVLLLVKAVFGGSSTSDVTRGSGRAVAQTRALPPFGGVELLGDVVVNVRVGPAQSVVVHADDNLVSRITTTVTASRLIVGTEPGSYRSKAPMHVDVTAPSLSALTLSGSGIVTLSNVDARVLVIRLPGSGMIRGSGSVGTLAVSVSGSGYAQLARLVATRARVSLDGSGTLAVTATDTFEASLGGSGTILYSGDPQHVTTSVTGSGTIVKS